MKLFIKNLLIVLLIFLLLGGVFGFFSSPAEEFEEISLTKLAQDINQGKVKEISISGNDVSVIYKDDTEVKTKKEVEIALSQSLINYGAKEESFQNVEIIPKEKEDWTLWIGPAILLLFPILIFVFFFWILMRNAKAGAMQAFNFSKAKAKLFGAEGHPKQKITFKDVAGLAEAKEELKEIVDFLKNPKKFLKMGARIPRGVLLMGPPGCGKTLLARAVAGQSNVPFFSVSGSEFVEMFVGVGASVKGDTPVLIKTENSINLLPIEKFVDQFYEEQEEGFPVRTEGVQTLGANWSKGNKFFKSSSWKKIKSVYRHKVNEIYEIQFLGGKMNVTGDHSVFIRDKNHIISKRADELKKDDILVNLPYKVRGVYVPGLGTTHKVKTHEFPEKINVNELLIWNENFQLERMEESYQLSLSQQGKVYQHVLGNQVGVCQMTISNWQNEISQPRLLWLASKYREKEIPQKIQITPSLLRLLGYYTAEGRRLLYGVEFIFGAHEKELYEDCISLMSQLTNQKPYLTFTEDNSLKIAFLGKVLGDFFEKHCGNGSHNKHVPGSLWDLPKEYFLSYLEGYSRGDGYTTKEGKLAMTSVSHQLILELAWLCSMHGIQVGITNGKLKGGRILKKKPLPESHYWVLQIGKTSHPFRDTKNFPYQFKRPKIKKITKKPYNGYVYDLCGCENEAFFGGEKPILLHNSRARDLFSTAKKAAPSILFIDELDAVGRHRGAGIGGGNDEREQTLNQILVEMDGFERDTNVIIVGATNRPDVLDPALLRPGRFDRRVVLDLPDINDRENILKIHAEGKPLSPDVKLREIAERTPGFSGADLANLINEAAILAARQNKKKVSQKEILLSIDKVLLGPERKSHILSKKEKEITAYHESGHALVSSFLPHAEPIRKISIIARGKAAGYTLKLPNKEKYIKTKSEFLSEIATLLGGYCAEKLVFKEISTGASSDLQEASRLARMLVKEYGMSEKLGPVVFGKKEELVFLGKEISEQRNYSEKVAEEIDREVSKLIKNSQETATRVLKKKRRLLEKLSKELFEKETIEREEFEKIIGKKGM